MHALTLTTILALTLGTSATNPWENTAPPAPPAKAPSPPSTSYIHATFQGANPPVAQYERTIPADGSEYYPSDPLSISHIVTDGGPCVFYGVDGLVLSKPASGLVDVGPPQTIVKAVCYPSQPGYKAKRFSA
jgi:hypothetical protein